MSGCLSGLTRGRYTDCLIARGVEPTEPSHKCQNARKGPESKGLELFMGQSALTVLGRPDYLGMLVDNRSTTKNRAGRNEADIQTAQPKAGKQARVSRPHEDCRWPEGFKSAPEAWAYPAGRQDWRQVGSTKAHPGRAEKLPRGTRIHRGSEIRELLKQGKREKKPHVEIFFGPSPGSRSRLGLIVPKYGYSVVERNLVKRRLREIGRRLALPALGGRGVPTDLLVRAKRSAYGADYTVLESEIRTAVEEWCSDRV
jgi:ribonuclease P protein component